MYHLYKYPLSIVLTYVNIIAHIHSETLSLSQKKYLNIYILYLQYTIHLVIFNPGHLQYWQKPPPLKAKVDGHTSVCWQDRFPITTGDSMGNRTQTVTVRNVATFEVVFI